MGAISGSYFFVKDASKKILIFCLFVFTFCEKYSILTREIILIQYNRSKNAYKRKIEERKEL